jgi:hypothetical protein
MSHDNKTVEQLFFDLAPYFGKYQISFQFWGRNNNNVYIMKDGVDLYDSGGHESVMHVLIDALNYLNRINRKSLTP